MWLKSGKYRYHISDQIMPAPSHKSLFGLGADFWRGGEALRVLHWLETYANIYSHYKTRAVLTWGWVRPKFYDGIRYVCSRSRPMFIGVGIGPDSTHVYPCSRCLVLSPRGCVESTTSTRQGQSSLYKSILWEFFFFGRHDFVRMD